MVVGPFTNVARAVLEEPDLARNRLEAIYLMGYKFDTLTSPFNVNGDLDAADILLKSGSRFACCPSKSASSVSSHNKSTIPSWQATLLRLYTLNKI